MSRIWKVDPVIEQIEQFHQNTIISHLDIHIVKIGDDFITCSMPVDKRTHQPMGLLHGGASVVLAESVGSLAANLCVEAGKQYCVGLDINANHVRSARSGLVYGTAKPVHIGRSTQVWHIDIEDEQGKLVCVSRLTMAVKDF